jgi:PAS domain S-box-containing protein
MAKEAPTRERMEEAEAQSEEKYNRPPEPASDAVLTVTRPAGKIVDANAAAAEMLGYSLPELIGLLGPREIVAPEVFEQTQREWVSQMRENGHYCVETVWVRKDGSRIPVKASGKPITLEGRPLLHLSARDIREREGAGETLPKAHDELEMRVKERTANLTSVNEQLQQEIARRKQAEEALREGEQRLRSIFEATFEGIAIHENGVILDANPAFERMFGYPLSEIIGKSVLDLAAEESRDVVNEKISAKAQQPFEAVGLRKDGTTLAVELIGKRHTYKGRGVTVTALRDVTERKRMEEALQGARDELESKVERQLLRRNPYGLTFRELAVLHLVAVGESDKQIGLKLSISHFTAQKHTSNILAKMGAGSRTEAASRALREGLLD